MTNKKIITALLITIAAAITACRSKEQVEEFDMAAEIGATHAREVSEMIAGGDSLAAQDKLIEIGSREGILRKHGATKVADRYHKAFLETLDSINPSLAEELRAVQTD